MKNERELTRKQSLQVLAVGAGGLFFLRTPLNTKEVVNNENTPSYIAQKTRNSCGVAVMAMLIADKRNENVEDVYKDIVDYYEMIDKPDVALGAPAITDYLSRRGIDSTQDSIKSGWNPENMKQQLSYNDSTIIDITSNYGTYNPDKNNTNHWVLIDKILKINNKSYSLIRDPLRSKEEFGSLEDLEPFMIPNENGSINVPSDVLFSAIGRNYIYINNRSVDYERFK